MKSSIFAYLLCGISSAIAAGANAAGANAADANAASGLYVDRAMYLQNIAPAQLQHLQQYRLSHNLDETRGKALDFIEATLSNFTVSDLAQASQICSDVFGAQECATKLTAPLQPVAGDLLARDNPVVYCGCATGFASAWCGGRLLSCKGGTGCLYPEHTGCGWFNKYLCDGSCS